MTDAEFLRFLRHGDSRLAVIVEVEYAYESGGSMATGTLYFSDCEDAVSGSQKYHSVIQSAPELERSIDLQRLGGRGSRTIGSVVLTNSDGAFDCLLDVIVDGRDAAIYIGEHGSARSDFRLLAKGAVASVSAPNDGEIVIQLRDKNYLLDDTIVGDPIPSGPNAGKPKPVTMGFIRNFDITPFLLDSADLTYYISNTRIAYMPHAIGEVSDVRDAGASLLTEVQFTFTSATMTVDAGTETFTFAGHGLSIGDVVVFWTLGAGSLFAGVNPFTQYWVIAAGFTANTFRLSLTRGGAAINITGTVMSDTWFCDRQRYYIDATNGTLQLSSSPAGRVTMDWVATPDPVGVSGWSFSDSPHGIMAAVLRLHTQLEESDDYDGDTIGELSFEESSTPVHYGLVVTDRTNVLDVLDRIAAATQSWYAWRSDGVLAVGKLDLANLDSVEPVDAITVGDLLADLTCENLPLNFGKITLDVDPNVVSQGDGLVSSVTATDRAKWVGNYQTRVTTTDPATTGYLANWWDYHKSAIDSPPIAIGLATGALFTDGVTDPAQAQVVVDEMTGLFRPWTRVHRCSVGIDKYALNPGDCVTVTYPRYGLESGAKCRVVSVRPSVSARRVDLVLVRQSTPDYTTVH